MKYIKRDGLNKRAAFLFILITMMLMYQNLPTYEESCNLWKGRKVLKQCESNVLKCNTFMLSLLFIYIILRSY